MELIKPAGVPEPKGHYSPAVVHNGLVYVSGQIPLDPTTGKVETGSIEAQTELVLKNVENVLHAAGSDLNCVLQITVYVADMALWDSVNAVYKRILGEHKPARAIVPVKELHYGTQIEIQAIAVLKDAGKL